MKSQSFRNKSESKGMGQTTSQTVRVNQVLDQASFMLRKETPLKNTRKERELAQNISPAIDKKGYHQEALSNKRLKINILIMRFNSLSNRKIRRKIRKKLLTIKRRRIPKN
jgi:hypothetical protein